MRWRSFHLALFCLTLAPLTWLANSTPFLKDAGELTSALWNGGIAHPTGFALQHVLAGIGRAIPLGAAGLRMAWMSVVAAAFVVIFVGLTVAFLVRRTGSRAGTNVPGILAGTSLLLADVAWFHTVNVEVYLPSLAMAALLIYLALRAMADEERGFWHLFCLLGGLGLGLHITVVGVAGVGFLGVVVSRLSKRQLSPYLVMGRLLIPGIFFALAGALVVLYLPLRSSASPVRVWAHVGTLSGFLGHLSGQSIRSSFAGTMLETGGAAWVHLQVYGEQMLAMAGSWLPLVVAGVWATIARRPLAAIVLSAWFAMDALFAVFVNPMGLMEKQTSLLSLLVLALLAGTGAAILVDKVMRMHGSYRVVLVPAALVATLFFLVLSPVRSLSPAERRARAGAHGYGMVRGAFTGMGPDGLLVTSQDDLSALSMYFVEVERRRPDVVHMIKQFICDGPFRTGVGRLHQDNGIVALWNDAAASCTEDGEDEVTAAWKKLLPGIAALTPPLRWELGDGALDRALRPILLPNYPVFDVRWDLTPGEREFRTAAFVSQMRGVDKRLSAHFADDVSRGVISEFFRLAGTFLLQGNADKGVVPEDCEMLISAVSLYQQNCRAWNNLGVCLVLAGRIGDGIKACHTGIEECPRYVKVRISELRYLLHAGQFEEAHQAFLSLRDGFAVEEWQVAVGSMRESALRAGNEDAVKALGTDP
jgi:hypothetical protein